METSQIGHVSFQICKFDKCIHFISQEYRLLFMHTTLIGAHFDKQIITADMRAGRPQLRLIVNIVMHMRRTICIACSPTHRNLNGLRLNILSSGCHMGWRNSKGTVFIGTDDESIGNG